MCTELILSNSRGLCPQWVLHKTKKKKKKTIIIMITVVEQNTWNILASVCCENKRKGIMLI